MSRLVPHRLHPMLTGADLEYVWSSYLPLEALARREQVRADRLAAWIEAGRLPRPAYLLPDGTAVFPPDLLELVRAAGYVDALPLHFARRTELAARMLGIVPDTREAGSVVLLSAGTFRTDHYVIVRKPVTLRGAGASVTILRKTNGASPNLEVPPDAQPIVIVGKARWAHPDEETSQALVTDGEKGSSSLTVASAKGFSPGQIVLVDELSGANWQVDPLGRGRVWAAPDWRVVWKLHLPRQPDDDPLTPTIPTGG